MEILDLDKIIQECIDNVEIINIEPLEEVWVLK
jgi:hypothetical protein